MSFFIRNSRGGGPPKRKLQIASRNGKKSGSGPPTKAKKKDVRVAVNDDESIASSDEELAEEWQKKNQISEASSSEEEETAQEKRLRLAKKYLEEIELQEKERGEFEEGAVSKRLQEEYLEEKGRLRKVVAASYAGHGEPFILRCKEQKLSITCMCLTSDGKYLFSGSKDGAIVKWSLADRVKLKVIKGKQKGTDGLKCVRCLAISSDSKYLVAGDTGSKEITIYSGDDMSHIKNLKGHRDVVSGLTFRRDTHTLYSASEDRSVKVWNLDEMAYVESMFGHQNGITSIDALSRERAITSGGYDGTIRIWKIVEESQLIFNGHGGSIDAVKLINEENFFSCGDDGQLCVWGSMKKKPLCSVSEAHGVDEINNRARWISSITTFLNTDLVASGSSDGMIRLWRCGEAFRSLTQQLEIKVAGFVNALTFAPDGSSLIAGIGQEHKLGRWWRLPQAKNSILIIPLLRKSLN